MADLQLRVEQELAERLPEAPPGPRRHVGEAHPLELRVARDVRQDHLRHRERFLGVEGSGDPAALPGVAESRQDRGGPALLRVAGKKLTGIELPAGYG